MDKPAVGQRTGFRFSLKWLLFSVVPVSLIAAALESATSAWAAAAATSTLLALFAAVVAAAFDARRRRPIWFGFAVCAGGYLLALFIASLGVSEEFATEQFNRALLENLHPGTGYPVDVPFFCPSLNNSADDDRRLAAAFRLLPPPRPFVPWPISETHFRAESLIATVDYLQQNSPATTSGTGAAPAASAPSLALNPSQLLPSAESIRQSLVAMNFKVIARCAWVWLVGAGGACVGYYLAARNAVTAKDSETVENGAAIKSTPLSGLRPLTVGVAILAVSATYAGFALRHSDTAWACAAMSAAAIAPIGLAIAAMFGNPRRRPYRAGFAICCGGYFLLSLFADPIQERETGLNHFLNETAESKSIGYFYERRFKAIYPHFLDPPEFGGGFASNDPLPPADVAVIFYTTAHGLMALFLGSLGGGLAWFLVWRRSTDFEADRAMPGAQSRGRGAQSREHPMRATKRLRSALSTRTLRHWAWAMTPLTIFAIVGAIALAHPTPSWASLALSAGALAPLGMVVAACYGSESRRPFRAGFAIAAGSYFLVFTLSPFPDASNQENFITSKALAWCYANFFPDSPLGGPAPSARYPVGIGYGSGGMGGFGGGGFGGGFGGGGFGGGASSDATASDNGGSKIADKELDPADSLASDAAASAANPAGQPPIFSTTPIPPPLNQQQQSDLIFAAGNFWTIGHSLWSLIFGWAGGFLAMFLARRQAKTRAGQAGADERN